MDWLERFELLSKTPAKDWHKIDPSYPKIEPMEDGGFKLIH